MQILFRSSKNKAQPRENSGQGSSEHIAIDRNECRRKGTTADAPLHVDPETRAVQSLGVKVLQEQSKCTAAVVE